MTLPKTMRAIAYRKHGPADEVLKLLSDVPVPALGHGEVLVKLAASGVNPHDTKMRSGWLGGVMPREQVIPHQDGAGTVVAVAPTVPEMRLGERVFVFGAGKDRPGEGTAAEYAAVSAQNAVALPDDYSFAEGASLGVPALTAYYAVLGDGPVAGQCVLVQGGAGAVGGVAIELAIWNGATVITTVSSDYKAENALAMGADYVINYENEDVAARVLDITKGLGADRIVEVDFGANVAVDAACLKPNGTVASYSSTRVRTPVLPYYDFALRGARLNLLQAGNLPDQMRADGTRVIAALLSRGHLHPRIAAKFPLVEVAQAHQLLESGEAVGNIVVEIDGK